MKGKAIECILRRVWFVIVRMIGACAIVLGAFTALDAFLPKSSNVSGKDCVIEFAIGVAIVGVGLLIGHCVKTRQKEEKVLESRPPRKMLASVLTVAAVVLFFVSVLYSLVCVVPWCEYDYHLWATVLCAVAVVLGVFWTVLEFRTGHYVLGSFGVLMSVISGFFLVVNAFAYCNLYSARVEIPENADFRAVCDMARNVLASSTGDRQGVLTSVSRIERFQYSFSAVGSDGADWSGYGGLTGQIIQWTIKRNEHLPCKAPSKSIERAYEEFRLQDPLIETNHLLRIKWDSGSECWRKVSF